MKQTPEPTRWLESAGETRDVAEELARELGGGPSAAQRAQLWVALEQVSGGVTESASEAPPSTPRGLAPLWKLGITGFLIAGVAAWLTLQVTAPQSESPSEQVAKPLAPSTTEAPSTPAPQAQLPEPAPAALTPHAAPARAKKRLTGRHEPDSVLEPQRAPVADPAVELQLLMRARRVLLADPARCLELTIEHARLYPAGTFSEEREVLAIDALRRMGQVAAAAERAQQFLKAYPDSTHRRDLESLTLSP